MWLRDLSEILAPGGPPFVKLTLLEAEMMPVISNSIHDDDDHLTL